MNINVLLSITAIMLLKAQLSYVHYGSPTKMFILPLDGGATRRLVRLGCDMPLNVVIVRKYSVKALVFTQWSMNWLNGLNQCLSIIRGYRVKNPVLDTVINELA